MKHPCGKVFDCSKKTIQRLSKNEMELKNTVPENLRNIGYALSVYFGLDLWGYYLPCGHYFFDHQDSPRDLINAPEEKKGISLEQLVNLSFPMPADNEKKIKQIRYYAEVTANIMLAIENIVATLEE
jgi:hypothetical protein